MILATNADLYLRYGAPKTKSLVMSTMDAAERENAQYPNRGRAVDTTDANYPSPSILSVSGHEEEPTLVPNLTRAPPKIKNWTKTTLALLFGSVVNKPVVKLTKVDINCEAELMEDKQLDYGAMEGLGDKYEP
ncbi:hypothetical protein K438DRAFT_1987980 [Mycena galopus ATCC 62051]|nr:hypothetical protein K438DRAFT_1987980 [Mycena galopus ATCC 62051]